MIDPGNLPGQTASLDFGEQTQMQRERKAIASAGRAQPGQPPPGAQPPSPAQGRAPQPGGQPTQPQPQQQRSTLTPDEVNGRVFSPPARVPFPYREGLQRAVSRAEAQGVSVPYLRVLMNLAHQGAGGAPPQGGQPAAVQPQSQQVS